MIDVTQLVIRPEPDLHERALDVARQRYLHEVSRLIPSFPPARRDEELRMVTAALVQLFKLEGGRDV